MSENTVTNINWLGIAIVITNAIIEVLKLIFGF